MPGTNQVKLSIGKESTPGTAVAPTAVLPIRSIGSLDRSIEKATDPVIVGAGMASGEYPVSADVKGSIPLSPRACAGFGQVLKGAFGSEAVAEVIGVIRIKYTGASASCKITTDNGAKSINAKIGALGSEANDAAFGTSGTITLTNVAHDTVGELQAAIEACTDYEAKILTGNSASTITSVVAGTYQAKGKWAVLVLTGTSGAHAHRFTPDLVSGSERPAFSIQKDGFQDNYRFAGCSVNSLSLSAALKAAAECDMELIGFSEAAGQSAMSGLSLNDSKPFIFGGGVTSISGVDYNYVRNVSAKAENGLKADGYGQASLDRAYHAKGMFAFSGDLKLRLDATSILERAKVETGVAAPLLFVFYAAESKKVGTSSVAEMLIIEVPYAELSNFAFEDNSGIIDCGAGWKAFAPGGTVYDPPVTLTLITSDATAY